MLDRFQNLNLNLKTILHDFYISIKNNLEKPAAFKDGMELMLY